MAERFGNLLTNLRQQRALKHWTRAAELAHKLRPSDLRSVQGQAKALRRKLDDVCQAADIRLKGPRIDKDVIDTPPQCDWAWRPDAWRGPLVPNAHVGVQSGTVVGQGLKLFHDCPLGEMTLRQTRNFGEGAQAPFGLSLDVLGFDGSFLSLVVDLPDDGRTTTTRSHILRLTGQLNMEKGLEAYARLNVKHGPNTEQLVSQLIPEDGRFAAEFDLGHAEVNEKRLENIWLDIIFDRPAMNRIELKDMTLMRRPRAEL